jgi:hypothetical protein
MAAFSIQHNVIYRSDEQFHVRFEHGERREEPYFLYYLFRPGGIWLSKTTDHPRLSLDEFFDQIDEAWVNSDPDHDEPMNMARELVYQCGRYKVDNATVYLTWKNNHLEEKQRTWHFRIRQSGALETDFGEYSLLPFTDEE